MKFLIAILAFLLGWLFMYLFSSFVAVSFDVTTWAMDGRFFTALFGSVIGGILAGAVMSSYE